MRHNIEKLICDIEAIVKTLIDTYKTSNNDFFFTEKEIHSYFYHLCLKSDLFITSSGLNLIHTEYPTPFKCSQLNSEPYIELAPNNSNKMRSHVDLVLLNPNFIDWISENKKSTKYITGLGYKLYSKYIVEFGEQYELFQKEYNEPILLFALEFKYFRHSYAGTKYPQKEIIYDKEKLKLLQKIKINEALIDYCSNVLSLVFIGHRLKNNFDKIKEKTESKNCIFIQKQ
ncbi:MAG: hypothetical protein CVU11_06240 [Bacteroidetes bacterium HGW-Bacteroidetes-6]|nr:MAG: hypothetical protein CVU11_06240 [Bacteroidetes bacterium HGW-Bacteroidetes-6]